MESLKNAHIIDGTSNRKLIVGGRDHHESVGLKKLDKWGGQSKAVSLITWGKRASSRGEGGVQGTGVRGSTKAQGAISV